MPIMGVLNTSNEHLRTTLNSIVSTALKKAFVADKIIQQMAKQDFIMLNLVVSALVKLCVCWSGSKL